MTAFHGTNLLNFTRSTFSATFDVSSSNTVWVMIVYDLIVHFRMLSSKFEPGSTLLQVKSLMLQKQELKNSVRVHRKIEN